MEGARSVCFCCLHSTVQNMNVRNFCVCVMECMCAQTRPQFILSSERVFFWGGGGGAMESEPILAPREKIPSTAGSEQNRTCNAAPAGQRAQHSPNWAILAPCLDLHRPPWCSSGRKCGRPRVQQPAKQYHWLEKNGIPTAALPNVWCCWLKSYNKLSWSQHAVSGRESKFDL